jgi:hypothetical protein
MTRGTDMGTDTMPRTPRQAPARAMPRGRAAAPGRTMPDRRAEPPRARRANPVPDPHGRTGPGSPNPRTRPLSAPRHTRPVAGSRPRLRRPRAPFILLLVGLLGGALISLLMISTTLAEGSFRITNLQQQNASLARQEQLLAQQVAEAESPAEIAAEAEQFGMQQDPNLRFINLKTGKIVTGKVPPADAQIDVPGYTP